MTRRLVDIRLSATARFLDGPHPEARFGELWICNVADDEMFGWQSARLGKVAYGKDRAVIPKLQPLFAQLSEVEAAPESVGSMGTVEVIRRKIVPYTQAHNWQIAYTDPGFELLLSEAAEA